MLFHRVKAIIWLHLIRLWRYKYSAFNMALNTTLWVAIFLLGALMFMPPENLPIGIPLAFWGIAMWTIMSSCVWLIGAWTNFYISMGFIEEHLLVNVSSSKVLVGRAITGLSVSTIAIILIYFALSSLTGISGGVINDPLLIIFGISIFIIMSLSYGLILSALSFRTGIPSVLLDIFNFIIFIVGGIATPILMLPGLVKQITFMIPYSYPAEIVRYAAVKYPTFIPLEMNIFISVFLAFIMAITSLFLMRWAESYVRKHGVKAIGRM